MYTVQIYCRPRDKPTKIARHPASISTATFKGSALSARLAIPLQLNESEAVLIVRVTANNLRSGDNPLLPTQFRPH
jgi:hypothetical protein